MDIVSNRPPRKVHVVLNFQCVVHGLLERIKNLNHEIIKNISVNPTLYSILILA